MGHEILAGRRADRSLFLARMLMDMATMAVDSTVHLFKREAVAWSLKSLLEALGSDRLCADLPRDKTERELTLDDMRRIADCAVKRAAAILSGYEHASLG